MNKDKVKKLARGGLLSAVILVMTIGIHVPVPATGGYVHLGDGFIFLAASVLGPSAALAAGIGSALADLVGGYFIYVPATYLIKAAMGFIAGKYALRSRWNKRLLIYTLSELVMAAGYLAFDWVIYGGAAALASLIPSFIQGAFGVVLGLALTEVASRVFSKME